MDAESSTLQKQLEGIPGLDVSTGLKTLGGRIESLARMIRKYADLHSDDANQLRLWLANGDRTSAHRLAHSVKGAAGFLGLTLIRERAAALEEALREAPDPAQVESQLAAFMADNERLCQAIRQMDAVATPQG